MAILIYVGTAVVVAITVLLLWLSYRVKSTTTSAVLIQLGFVTGVFASVGVLISLGLLSA